MTTLFSFRTHAFKKQLRSYRYIIDNLQLLICYFDYLLSDYLDISISQNFLCELVHYFRVSRIDFTVSDITVYYFLNL